MAELNVTTAAEKNLLQLKHDALENGELTDFSFLVGPDEEPQLLHCFKSDLQVASEYFRALLRSPLTGPPPVRVRHIQPHIFQNILECICLQSVTPIKTSVLDDAMAHALAVDEFLLDTLKPLCKAEIEKLSSVHNIWKILNQSKNISFIQEACIKVLSTKTKECLAHESFLDASQDGLIFLLKQDKLNIETEAELVEACFKWIKDKPEEAGNNLMKEALPHLRLLTLKVEEAKPELLALLSDSEELFLLRYLCGKTGIQDIKLIPGCLNEIASARKTPHKEIMPNNISADGETRHEQIVLDLLKFESSDSELLSLQVNVKYCDTGRSLFSSQKFEKRVSYFSWFYFEFKEAICIPKDTLFEVIIETENCQFSTYNTKNLREWFETASKHKNIRSCNFFSSSYHSGANNFCLIKSLHFETV